MQTVKSLIGRLVREDEGESLVEYVLLVALIAVVAITGMALIGTASNEKLNAVGTKVNGVTVP